MSINSKVILLVSAAMLTGPAVALAQSAASDAGSEVDQVDEIVVTGSRLLRPDSIAPMPVTSIDAGEIDASGVTLISDFLQQLPVFGINTGRMTEIGGGETNMPSSTVGTERLNLRDLGVDRTLVVVNGRRHVGSTAGSTAVDVGSIPTALIERVEISTGGASTAYGADAIAGVANFVMRRDFEGIQFDSRFGFAEEGGGSNKYYAVTMGSNFAERRGNAVFSASYNSIGGIQGIQRSYMRERWGFASNPLDTGPFDGEPATILRRDTRGLAILNQQGSLLGLLDPGLDAMLIFNDDGSVRPIDLGDPGSGGSNIGGDGIDPLTLSNISTPMQRMLFNGSLNYALTERTNFFLDAKTYISDAQARSPALLNAVLYPEFGDLFLVFPDNPFLPSSPLLDDMFARNFGLVTFSKYHDDLPLRRVEVNRVLNQVVAGIEGETGVRDWNYEIFASWGRTTEEFREFNNRDRTRWRLATDPVTDVDGVTGVAPGTPVCRATLQAALAGGTEWNPDILECRPINIFGRGNASQESLDYVLIDLLTNKSLEQSMVGASFTGTLFELPAGPASFAAGVEYRGERSENLPDPMQQAGRTHEPMLPAVVGSYNVTEAYLESRFPLLQDAPFAELLAIEGGFRASDNSVTGGSNSWHAGGEWAPVQDVRFRSMYSRAVRAPNVGELFTPQSPRFTGSALVQDPCLMNNVGGGPAPERRLRNCTDDLEPLGLDPLTFEFHEDFVGTSFGGIGGGNPDLTEEKATSITYGVVLNPRFIPNLTVSLDYYDIVINDVITTPTAVSVTEGCYDNFDSIDNQLCGLVTRDSDPNSIGYGTIASVQSTTLNLARLSTSGVDLQADYRWMMGRGVLTTRVFVNYIESYREKPLQDAVLESELKGSTRLPEFRGGLHLGYHTGPLSLSYRMRYIGSVRLARVAALNPIETTRPYEVGSETISDVSATYGFEVGRYNLQLSLGVNNVFDSPPPPAIRAGSRLAGSTPYYDPIGRFYFGGLRINF